MRILININHPSHVYFFKYIIKQLKKNGHDIQITCRDKDKTLELLEKEQLDYILVSKCKSSVKDHIIEMIGRIKAFHRIISEFSPDIFISALDPAPAIACKFNRIPFICFLDSEPAYFLSKLTLPFCDVVFTPTTFRKKLGKKQVFVNSFKELAYLHPDNFSPNPGIIKELGLKTDEQYVVIRFVSWTAHHDVGHKGICDKVTLVRELSKYSRVFISSEKELDTNLSSFRLKVSPEKIHDVLAYATLFFGDSQTMTTESAILGTPAIRCNSFVGKDDMGNFIELEKKYGLIYNFSDEKKALNFALSLLKTPNIKGEWAKKQKKLLKDKIDMTGFMIWFIENYPMSFTEIKEHPEVQYSCASASGDVL